MSTFTSLLLLVSLTWQGLTFSPPQTWSFTGLVLETRQVELYGFPSQVARIQSRDFTAWVIQRLETEGPEGEVRLGNARPGDRVRVYLSGPQVLKNQIDWSLCGASAICHWGYFYDDGLFSPDWKVPVTPSNQFIQTGRPNPSWQQALFWRTQVLPPARAHRKDAQ